MLAVVGEQGHRFLAVQGFGVILVQGVHLFAGVPEDGQGVLCSGIQAAGEELQEMRPHLQQFNLIDRFQQQGGGVGGIGRSGNGFRDVVQGRSVLGGALLVLAHPGHERGLFLLLAFQDAQFLKGELLALPFLPAVRAAGIFVRILQADLRVGFHGFPHDVLAQGARLYRNGLAVQHLLQLGGGLETLGTARIAHDHGKIAILVAFEGYLQRLLGYVGNIVLAIVGRFVVGTGIDPEHGEIARVARPHPVVGLAAEFSHGCRGCAHKTDIRIGLGHNQIEDVAVVERRDAGLAVRDLGFGLLLQRFARLVHGRNGQHFTVGAVFVLFQCGGANLVQDGRHVRHGLQEGNRQAFGRQFFCPRHGPIAILQIIVFGRGKLLDMAVAAVVVGYHQAFPGNHLSGAAAAEMDDGIFQRGMVHGINLFGRQAAAQVFHGSGIHFLEQREHPHALVRQGHRGRQGEQHQAAKHFFHKTIC